MAPNTKIQWWTVMNVLGDEIDRQTDTTQLLCIYVNFVCGMYKNLAQHNWKETVVPPIYILCTCIVLTSSTYSSIQLSLGVFVQSRQAPVTISKSLRLFVCTYQSDSHRKDFRENWYCVYLWKLSKIQIRLKLGTNIEHITWRPE